MYKKKILLLSLNVKENKEYSTGSQSWKKNFCLRKKQHMGQVWKDEKSHQVEMGGAKESY